MKIVKTGYNYRIYDDSLETFDLLPPHSYQLVFQQLQGFYLEEIEDIKVTEKIYGVHQQKVDKIMKSFELFERNLGVILSGDKGIGKSISAKLLAQEALKKFLPVIFVNSYVPGVADYIASIKQPVVVIFDEFDKTFSNKDEENDCQTEMLTLFDGIYPGKKLFVITCNNINHLNEFLINRPGRFHYHLRFDYPSPEEIQEYLQDKLKPEYYDQIPKVISFSGRVDLNYDCLRAIAFELNIGESFEKCIGDLNIISTDDRDSYSATVIFKNGMKANCKHVYFDPYADDNEETIKFNLENSPIYFYLDVETGDCKFDYEKGILIIDGSCVQGDIEWYNRDDDEIDKTNLPDRSMIDHLVLKRKYPKSIHYTV